MAEKENETEGKRDGKEREKKRSEEKKIKKISENKERGVLEKNLSNPHAPSKKEKDNFYFF